MSQRISMRPNLNVEPCADGPFRWLALNDDPQFVVDGVELIAGHWVRLKARVQYESKIASAIFVFQDHGSGFNEHHALRLYPDEQGYVSFIWRTKPNLRNVRIDPIGRPGKFSFDGFSLEPVSEFWISFVVIGYALRHRLWNFGAHVVSGLRDWRGHGFRGFIRKLLQSYNEAGRILDDVDAPAAAHEHSTSDKSNFARLHALERYVNDGFQRTTSKVTWNSRYVPKVSDMLDPASLDIKTIAFYLPQFHPIPENDEWWGKGFTEWTNVSKALPQFIGHYQPHLPGELGFYDLRIPDVMRQQIDLAKQYGIAGFCFHYYWFGGKRLLEAPLNMFLGDPTLDIEFCLCWANENWTRRWDGQDTEVLLGQQHSPEDDIAFIEALIPAFRDPRYIRIDDKPVLIVYRASLLPDPAATALRWRECAREHGIKDLYLVAARSFEITDPRPYEFDAAVEFPPHQVNVSEVSWKQEIMNPSFRGKIYDYEELAKKYGSQVEARFVNFKTVMPSWDNEARKPATGHVFVGSSPYVYAKWLDAAADVTLKHKPSERLLFINAWNEWAEGAHLEPDRHFGYGYLHATANVLRNYFKDDQISTFVETANKEFRKKSDTAIVLHLYYEDLIDPLSVRYLMPLRDMVDLFVTVKVDVTIAALKRLRAAFPNCYFIRTINRGRDIRPFIIALRKIHELGYLYGCKIHTKKSPQLSDGEEWRETMLESILNSSSNVKNICQSFEVDPSLGLLMPKAASRDLSFHDTNIDNRPWLNTLLSRLEMKEFIGNYKFSFPAGSMYWFRVAALSELLSDRFVSLDEFELEAGQLDGTLAHAIERLVGLIASREKYRVSEVSVNELGRA